MRTTRQLPLAKTALGTLTALTPLLATMSLVVTPSTARADFYTHRWESHHQAEGAFHLLPELTYFYSKSNFRSDGTKVIPGNFNSFSRIQTDVTLEYGVFGPVAVYGRLTWASARVSTIAASTAQDASGLLDQTLGVTARVHQGKASAIDLQLQLDLPAYDNLAALQAGNMLLGDGSTDVTLGAIADLSLNQDAESTLALVGGLGYTSRNKTFPKALPWSVELRYNPSKPGLGAGGGAFGLYSFDPTPALDASRPVSTSAGASGSFIVNSPQPTYGALRGFATYDVGPETEMRLSLSQTVTGSAAPTGLTITLGVSAQFGVHSSLEEKE